MLPIRPSIRIAPCDHSTTQNWGSVRINPQLLEEAAILEENRKQWGEQVMFDRLLSVFFAVLFDLMKIPTDQYPFYSANEEPAVREQRYQFIRNYVVVLDTKLQLAKTGYASNTNNYEILCEWLFIKYHAARVRIHSPSENTDDNFLFMNQFEMFMFLCNVTYEKDKVKRNAKMIESMNHIHFHLCKELVEEPICIRFFDIKKEQRSSRRSDNMSRPGSPPPSLRKRLSIICSQMFENVYTTPRHVL